MPRSKKNIFSPGVVLDYLNKTLVTLIPKCQNPETLSNFRPINLCKSVYKVVSKIIIGRIRLMLSKLISLNQTAFVPGRKSVDNVLIAQELIYSLDRRRGRVGYMAIKVDLAKAYDKLEWSFIHKVLQAFHFPQNLIKVIMNYITSMSISILLNGSAMEPFNPLRGIKQGNPLSPYIFILCMEFLGHLIEKKCSEGSWCPLKASRGNVGISHLFFIDDLILFAKVNNKACEAISNVLQKFCFESRKKISVEKSKIYFSPNVDPTMKERVCDRLGMQATTCLGE